MQLPVFGVYKIARQYHRQDKFESKSRNEKTGAVIITVSDPVSSATESIIEICTKPGLQRNDITIRALEILDRAQIDHDLEW
jgi:hypothetical protein